MNVIREKKKGWLPSFPPSILAPKVRECRKSFIPAGAEGTPCDRTGRTRHRSRVRAQVLVSRDDEAPSSLVLAPVTEKKSPRREWRGAAFHQLADRYGCQSITRHVSRPEKRLRLGTVQRSRPYWRRSERRESNPPQKPHQIFTEEEKRESGTMKNGGRKDGGPDGEV